MAACRGNSTTAPTRKSEVIARLLILVLGALHQPVTQNIYAQRNASILEVAVFLFPATTIS